MSPQQLKNESKWYASLLELASRGCISAICIDEEHSTVQNYESFHPKFKTAMHSVDTIVSMARMAMKGTFYYVPILAMSATFTMSDQNHFNKLIGRQLTMVFLGEMSCRNISFKVFVTGNPMHSLIGDWSNDAVKLPTSSQSLVYSNSVLTCNVTLIPKLTVAREKMQIHNGVFLALTGDCGIMLK